MFVTRALARLTLFAGLMALSGTIPSATQAQQVGATDIGGTVVGAAGPEAERELQRLGTRLWPGGFGEAHRKTRANSQSHRGAGTERSSSRALLSCDLLVCDDENPACRGFRRQE